MLSALLASKQSRLLHSLQAAFPNSAGSSAGRQTKFAVSCGTGNTPFPSEGRSADPSCPARGADPSRWSFAIWGPRSRPGRGPRRRAPSAAPRGPGDRPDRAPPGAARPHRRGRRCRRREARGLQAPEALQALQGLRGPARAAAAGPGSGGRAGLLRARHRPPPRRQRISRRPSAHKQAGSGRICCPPAPPQHQPVLVAPLLLRCRCTSRKP
mmetsp:Transcript_3653/g.10629  ORF Transcript_3653/g.10629 Transcript_3653/m.10629 type:complete len:212 (+) Transcript_3653:496-1131(+)